MSTDETVEVITMTVDEDKIVKKMVAEIADSNEKFMGSHSQDIENFKRIVPVLLEKGIDYKKFISKKILPDDAIFVIVNNTFFILEIKIRGGCKGDHDNYRTADHRPSGDSHNNEGKGRNPQSIFQNTPGG